MKSMDNAANLLSVTSTLVELERLVFRGYLSQPEANAVVRRRNQYENGIFRSRHPKNFLLSGIAFENKLLNLLSIRKVLPGSQFDFELLGSRIFWHIRLISTNIAEAHVSQRGTLCLQAFVDRSKSVCALYTLAQTPPGRPETRV